MSSPRQFGARGRMPTNVALDKQAAGSRTHGASGTCGGKAAARVSRMPILPRPKPQSRRPRPTRDRRGSISATPKSARRSTAMSAIARRRPAPMSSQGTYLLTIVPAHGLWVDANFKERPARPHEAGQPATIVADTLPGHVFHGHLLSLAPATGAVFSVIPPENATGNFTKIVQRVPVRIALDDDDAALGKIRPGLSTIATVDTRSQPEQKPKLHQNKRRSNNESDSTANWLRGLLPFVVICFGGFMALLDIQIVASSLQNIGGGLSAAQDEISWVQTAYLIAEIIVIPLSGWLTRVFSTRWLFTASAAGFTITSMLCGLAWDIHSMILFRALQGALGASMVPTIFTSSFYYFQGPRRVYSAAVVGTIASTAPTLGPIIGGWITDTLDWHWLFYVNVLPGLAVAILIPLLVDIDKPDLRLLKEADYLGIVLMAISLGTLEYVLEEGTRWNWFDEFDDQDLHLHCRSQWRPIRRAKPHLRASSGGFAGPHQSKLFRRMHFVVYYRHRHILDDLFDTPLSRLC